MLLGMSSHVNETLLHLQKNKAFGEIRNLATSLFSIGDKKSLKGDVNAEH